MSLVLISQVAISDSEATCRDFMWVADNTT